jgi:hypothetical protein
VIKANGPNGLKHLITDGTGEIEVKIWTAEFSDGLDPAQHIRVMGKLDQWGSKPITINHVVIDNINDPYEVYYHCLLVMTTFGPRNAIKHRVGLHHCILVHTNQFTDAVIKLYVNPDIICTPMQVPSPPITPQHPTSNNKPQHSNVQDQVRISCLQPSSTLHFGFSSPCCLLHTRQELTAGFYRMQQVPQCTMLTRSRVRLIMLHKAIINPCRSGKILVQGGLQHNGRFMWPFMQLRIRIRVFPFLMLLGHLMGVVLKEAAGTLPSHYLPEAACLKYVQPDTVQ